MKPLRSMLFIFLVFTTSSGCTLLTKGERANPELSGTLSNLTYRYMRSIMAADFRRFDTMILWVDYTQNPSKGRTKAQVIKEIREAHERFKPEQHPLAGQYVVHDVRAKENSAHVFLGRKGDKSGDSLVWVQFNWVGTAWFVQDDNIFGPDGIVSKALATPPA